MTRKNKSGFDCLFDPTLGWTIDSAPCYRLMGAIMEQAVADYQRLYRQKLKGHKEYRYLGTRYDVETSLAELRAFFEMYCEGTRFSADQLIRIMEETAPEMKLIQKLTHRNHNFDRSKKNGNYPEKHEGE